MKPESALKLNTERLREMREQSGLSQRELGRLCGFGSAQVNRYEAGLTDPSATHLALIADALNVSADYLLGRTDFPRERIDETSMTVEEEALLNSFRRAGWSGVFHLGADKIAK